MMMNKYCFRTLANRLLVGNLLALRQMFGKLVSDKIEDRRIIYDPNTDIGSALYFSGGFEKKELELCKKYIKSDSVVLDIGANIGLHSIYFSQIARTGLIISFEPSQETFSLLLRNIDGIDNILPVNIGVADHTNIADFFIATDNAYSSLKDTKRKDVKRKAKVLCVALDDLFSQLNFDRIDFMKIDVEGLEQKVLEGLQGIIEKYHPVIFCEIYQGANSNEDPEKTVKFVIARGYNAFVFDGQKLVPFEKHDDRLYNYLFSPRDKDK